MKIPSRVLRFATVGVINTLTDIGVFFVLVALTGQVIPSNILAYGSGAAVSFILNRGWTFADVAGDRSTKNLALRFVALNLAALTLSTVLVAGLNSALPLAVAKLLSVGVTAIFSYVGMRYLVFASK